MVNTHGRNAARDQSDEALLRAFAGGDDDALAELARRYETALLGLARGLLGRSDLARDAVQETWMRVIRYAASFHGRASVKTWLYRIAINRCRDMGRQASRMRAIESGELVDEPTTSHDITEQLVQADRDALREAVDRLSGPRREVVLLCFHRDFTHEQAAEILQLPPGTLKSRLRAVLAELRRSLRRTEVAA